MNALPTVSISSVVLLRLHVNVLLTISDGESVWSALASEMRQDCSYTVSQERRSIRVADSKTQCNVIYLALTALASDWETLHFSRQRTRPGRGRLHFSVYLCLGPGQTAFRDVSSASSADIWSSSLLLTLISPVSLPDLNNNNLHKCYLGRVRIHSNPLLRNTY